MTKPINITVYSEPLIEKFGDGYSSDSPRPETPCSGDGLNMAAGIARIGKMLADYNGRNVEQKVSLLCGLGSDAHGDTIRDFMDKEGLSREHAITIKDRPTSAYIINKAASGEDRPTVYENRGPDSAMCQLLENGPHRSRADAALQDIATNTDILVITGIGASRARSDEAFAKLEKLARDVKKGGGKIVVDFNHRAYASGKPKLWVNDANEPMPNAHVRERMERLYKLADLAVIAHDEISPVFGDVYKPPLEVGQKATDPMPMLEYFKNLKAGEGLEGPRHVLFKRGAAGGTFFYQNPDGSYREPIITPGSQVITADRNGGGDALIAGTIAGLVGGYTLDQSIFIGQKMASKAVQHLGGVINLFPDKAELAAAIPKEEKTQEHWGKRPPGQRAARDGSEAAVGA